jgi:hypothetical protein
VRDTPQDDSPATVPAGATQVGAARARWAWTAAEVWTERMLTALEEGVKGARWHTLIDQVYAERTLRAACARVKATRGAPGVDHVRSTLVQRLLCDRRVVFLSCSPLVVPSVRSAVTSRPESRMREICTSGSEGGARETNRVSLPLSRGSEATESEEPSDSYERSESFRRSDSHERRRKSSESHGLAEPASPV